MPRTIAALFESREEAEYARGRLIGELKAKSPRIIGKDTAAAIDNLDFAKSDADAYRARLRQGGYLLVADVPSGIRAKQVAEVVEGAIGRKESADVSVPEPAQSFHVEPAADEPPPTPKPAPPRAEQARENSPPQRQPRAAQPAPDPSRAREEQSPVAAAPAQPRAEPPPQPEPVKAEAPPAEVPQQRQAEKPPETASVKGLRTGAPEMTRGGARVRAFTREAEVEEQVTLRDELVEVENRESGRRLSSREIEDAELFKQRVIEIAEMREEPVVSKVAIVREEVIVRKRIQQRTETIRDTVRHTEIEVEDLADDEADAPALFGQGRGGGPARRAR